MNIFNWFKNDYQKVDFKFVDVAKTAFTDFHPILAKDIKPLRNFQEKKYGEYHFPNCPGMFDYSRMGYLIPAWTNFHIRANKAGSVARIGSIGVDGDKRKTNFSPPNYMDNRIADGAFKREDNVASEVHIFSSPWKIHRVKPNLSLLLLPALFHSDFLDDLFVYPGCVDFKNGFKDINFVVSPKRKCDLKITAGDPVLHAIPIITTQDIIAEYGPATLHEGFHSLRTKWYHEKSFYRKFYMTKKKYKLLKEKDSK